MTTLLRPTALHSNQFHYDAATRTYIAEISDFGKDFRFGQVWDDSCDEGVTLYPSYDRNPEAYPMVFVVDHVDKDDDGDVMGWRLKAATLGQPIGRHVNFSLLIIND